MPHPPLSSPIHQLLIYSPASGIQTLEAGLASGRLHCINTEATA